MEKVKENGTELYPGKGYPLRAAMLQKMYKERKKLQVLADELGISYSNMLHLGKGSYFGGLKIELIRNVANYLGISTVQALILAEFLIEDDLKRVKMKPINEGAY